MTSKLDVVRTYLDKAWAHPPESLQEASKTYISDDFKSMDDQGNVLMDKATYIGMGQMMAAAFSGFKWVLRDLTEEADGVLMRGHFEGTHIRDLNLSAMGAGVIPPSGKRIVWPDATVKWKVEGNQIMSEQALESGGIAAFLAPLGVKLPAA